MSDAPPPHHFKLLKYENRQHVHYTCGCSLTCPATRASISPSSVSSVSVHPMNRLALFHVLCPCLTNTTSYLCSLPASVCSFTLMSGERRRLSFLAVAAANARDWDGCAAEKEEEAHPTASTDPRPNPLLPLLLVLYSCLCQEPAFDAGGDVPVLPQLLPPEEGQETKPDAEVASTDATTEVAQRPPMALGTLALNARRGGGRREEEGERRGC